MPKRSAETVRLKTEKVHLGYGDFPIIEGLDLQIPQGKIGAIVGPNGCGKSTLLKALARLLPVQSGSILLDGQAISSLPTRSVAKIVGILPQSPSTPESISVEELVARGRHPHHGMFGGWDHTDDTAVEEALRLTGLSDLATRAVDTLSGGQRQRAWIALSLAQHTDILLLDEPTTYLDMTYQLEVLDLLAELNISRGTTILMVLHDLNLASRYADWILALKDGGAAAVGSPSQVITEDFVRSVFRLDSRVTRDPDTGTPVVTPLAQHSLAALRAKADGAA
ncbi:MAG: ABC transporter ATP-binding protein [Bifidobacteriaceae bacterium]|jgi:iron complex transport system ATP-binding protein|nr:ABC transporter ATP-binding protein [Bifidobacteriaceae bacterium]